MQNLEKYSKPALRIALALVFLYFGFQQVTNPVEWSGYVPDHALVLGLQATTVVIINAFLELILGLFLLVGLFTRISSFILAVHLLVITISLGFNEIAVRDFGLTIATFVIFLNGPDKYCLDKKFTKNH